MQYERMTETPSTRSFPLQSLDLGVKRCGQFGNQAFDVTYLMLDRQHGDALAVLNDQHRDGEWDGKFRDGLQRKVWRNELRGRKSAA